MTAAWHRDRKSAFTLVELLVVVSIIALLLSILMPSLRSARNQAKAAVCLANMKRLGTGMAVYLNTSGDKFPPFRLKTDPSDPAPVTYVNHYGRSKPRWQWFIADNIGPVIDPRPFTLPFGDGDVGSGGEGGRTMTNKYFLCPSLTGPDQYDVRNGAYGYNYQYLGNSRADTNPTEFDNFSVSADHLRAASQTVLFADSRGGDPKHGKHSYSLDPPRLAVERNAVRFGPGSGDLADGMDPSLYQYSPAEMRHAGRAMVAFIDSHAEGMRLADLGYEVNGQGVALPVDPIARPAYTASNKLWTGHGADPLTAAAQP
ncbi:MAG: prepilin-type N-terminal cleavage/methylation domain-containing protein [bacterium]|nr:prepilin-type N-terminal cleavage/methylation domain-containing protein [bacterium]